MQSKYDILIDIFKISISSVAMFFFFDTALQRIMWPHRPLYLSLEHKRLGQARYAYKKIWPSQHAYFRIASGLYSLTVFGNGRRSLRQPHTAAGYYKYLP